MQQRTTTVCSVLFCDVFISAWLCTSRSVWVNSGIVCLICVSLRYVPPVISYTQIRFVSLNSVWSATHSCILQLLFEKSKLLIILWYSWIFAGRLVNVMKELHLFALGWSSVPCSPQYDPVYWLSVQKKMLWPDCSLGVQLKTVMTQTVCWVFI